MRLWEKIKSFFSGGREASETEIEVPSKAAGDLEVTVEAVSSAEEPDIDVDIFEMENDDVPADYEDPDIEVEIVEEDTESSDETAVPPETRSHPENADLIPTSAAENAVDSVPQSRMTEEYKAWLDQQLEEKSTEEAQDPNSQKE